MSRKGAASNWPSCTMRMRPSFSRIKRRLLPSPAWVTKSGWSSPSATACKRTATALRSGTAGRVAVAVGVGSAAAGVGVGSTAAGAAAIAAAVAGVGWTSSAAGAWAVAGSWVAAGSCSAEEQAVIKRAAIRIARVRMGNRLLLVGFGACAAYCCLL